MRLNEIKYDIAAQVDSNGRQVKMPKIMTHGPSRTYDDLEIGNKFKRNGNTFIVTKISPAKVWLDVIDEEGNPVKFHSGEHGYTVSKTRLWKEYRRI